VRSQARYPIDSATALSVIIHPKNPFAPSMHFHISYMEPRGKGGYWRLIADLNPSIPSSDDTAAFKANLGTIRHLDADIQEAAFLFGDRYFYIPSLDRHRGECHLFVGDLTEGDMPKKEQYELAHDLAQSTIKCYAGLVQKQLDAHPQATITAEDRARQLHYHTLYLFQVLTLDRGTTHGLLAHDENDVGTLGSLPNHVDRALLQSWLPNVPAPQDELLKQVIAIL